MLFEKLGTLDLITVLILIGAAILPSKLLYIAAIYLVVKGMSFILISKDFASYIDVACGIYLFVLSHGIKIPLLHNVVLLWLLQKTIMTFIAIGLKTVIFYYENRDQLPEFLR